MKNQDKIDVNYVLAALGKCPLAPGSPSGPPSPAVVSVRESALPASRLRQLRVSMRHPAPKSPALPPVRSRAYVTPWSSPWERSGSGTEIHLQAPPLGLIGCFGKCQLLAPKG